MILPPMVAIGAIGKIQVIMINYRDSFAAFSLKTMLYGLLINL